jgi:hypothetical protein
MIIQDPSTMIAANVNGEGHLETRSITIPFYSWVSDKNSGLFTWASSYATGGAETILYIQNLDPSRIMKHNRIMLSSAVNQLWTIIRVTGGTPAGTIVTPSNLNFSSVRVPLSSAYGNAEVTGAVVGDVIFRFYALASTLIQLYLDGSIIVPYSEAIAITCDAAGIVAVDIEGFFPEAE